MLKLAIEIRFIRQINVTINHIILSFGIKHSVRDLLCDDINNAWPAKYSDIHVCVTLL